MAPALRRKLLKIFSTCSASAALAGCVTSEPYMAQPSTPVHEEWSSAAEWAQSPDYKREIRHVRDVFDNDVNVYRAQAHARKLGCKSAFELSAKDTAAETTRDGCAKMVDAVLLEDLGGAIEKEMKLWRRVDSRHRSEYMSETGRSSGTYESLSDADLKQELRFICQRLALKQADGRAPDEGMPKVCADLNAAPK